MKSFRHMMWLLAAAFLLTATLVWADHGPRPAPCEGCPKSESEFPFPRTGMWYDPARDGSGISLEIQNGVGFGLFYSYTEGGEPTWYAFSGDLVPMDDDGEGYWTLESPLTHFTGGVCIDCPYREPEELVTHGQLRMTVVQRNLISHTVDGGQEFRMQPLVWGEDGADVS